MRNTSKRLWNASSRCSQETSYIRRSEMDSWSTYYRKVIRERTCATLLGIQIRSSIDNRAMVRSQTATHALVVEEGFGERCGVERLKIRELFANPDELYWNFQFVDDADDDASLGGTIELGHDEPGEP